jgi:nicotinate-nucleotide adenylyltransferase
MALSLPEWRDPEGVLALARIGVAAREGAGRAEILEHLRVLPGSAERLEFFEMPRVDVSSSLIRARAAAGFPLRYLVPAAVARFIDERRPYGGPSPLAPPTA